MQHCIYWIERRNVRTAVQGASCARSITDNPRLMKPEQNSVVVAPGLLTLFLL